MSGELARGSTTQRLLLDAWVLGLTVVLTLPLWTSRGHGLARDLIFTPERPLTLDTVGLGSSLPRAVPLDAVLALGTQLVGGEIMFRACVAGVLVFAGWGAHRALAEISVWGRAATATVAVWNPFVVERIAMGQWALLSCYAALFWLAVAIPRVLRGERGWPVVVLGMGLASLTPTGGAIALLLTVVVAALVRTRRSVLLVALGLVCQLPWLLPSLLGQHQLTSDPRGADAFAARGGPAGTLVSLLGGGGIWNPFATPGSQDTWYAVVAAALMVGSLWVARRTLWTQAPTLVVCAVLGFLLAAVAVAPGGGAVISWLVREIPGGGLLRDGQKWVLGFVVLGSLGLGVAVDRVRRATHGSEVSALVGVLLVALPVVALPDAPGSTWEVLRPVRYPASYESVVRTLDEASPDSGDVVTLPWASYRRFTWGLDLSAADPLPRWTSRPVVVSDTLATAEGELSGEDPRAAAVGRVLAGPPGDVARELGRLGVGWVVRHRGVSDAGEALGQGDFPGLTTIHESRELQLERVEAPVESPPSTGPVRRWLVIGVDLLVGLGVLLAAGIVLAGRVLRRSARASDNAC